MFLRGIDLHCGRPWDLPAAHRPAAAATPRPPGDADGMVGFVRRGDAVEMVSADSTFYPPHAAGAAFFTLAFPDPTGHALAVWRVVALWN